VIAILGFWLPLCACFAVAMGAIFYHLADVKVLIAVAVLAFIAGMCLEAGWYSNDE
jgi:hypothetical protein